jgi:hypothetical protein
MDISPTKVEEPVTKEEDFFGDFPTIQVPGQTNPQQSTTSVFDDFFGPPMTNPVHHIVQQNTPLGTDDIVPPKSRFDDFLSREEKPDREVIEKIPEENLMHTTNLQVEDGTGNVTGPMEHDHFDEPSHSIIPVVPEVKTVVQTVDPMHEREPIVDLLPVVADPLVLHEATESESLTNVVDPIPTNVDMNVTETRPIHQDVVPVVNNFMESIVPPPVVEEEFGDTFDTSFDDFDLVKSNPLVESISQPTGVVVDSITPIFTTQNTIQNTQTEFHTDFEEEPFGEDTFTSAIETHTVHVSDPVEEVIPSPIVQGTIATHFETTFDDANIEQPTIQVSFNQIGNETLVSTTMVDTIPVVPVVEEANHFVTNIETSPHESIQLTNTQTTVDHPISTQPHTIPTEENWGDDFDSKFDEQIQVVGIEPKVQLHGENPLETPVEITQDIIPNLTTGVDAPFHPPIDLQLDVFDDSFDTKFDDFPVPVVDFAPEIVVPPMNEHISDHVPIEQPHEPTVDAHLPGLDSKDGFDVSFDSPPRKSVEPNPITVQDGVVTTTNPPTEPTMDNFENDDFDVSFDHVAPKVVDTNPTTVPVVVVTPQEIPQDNFDDFDVAFDSEPVISIEVPKPQPTLPKLEDSTFQTTSNDDFGADWGEDPFKAPEPPKQPEKELKAEIKIPTTPKKLEPIVENKLLSIDKDIVLHTTSDDSTLPIVEKKVKFSIPKEEEEKISTTTHKSPATSIMQTPAPTEGFDDEDDLIFVVDKTVDAFNDDFDTFQGSKTTGDEIDEDFGEFETSTEQEVFESPMKSSDNTPTHMGIYDIMTTSNLDVMMSTCDEIMNRVLPNLFKGSQNDHFEAPQGSIDKLFRSNQTNVEVFERMATWNGSIIETQFWKSLGIVKEQKPTINKRTHTRNISIYESTELQPKQPEIDMYKVSRNEMRVETKKPEVKREPLSITTTPTPIVAPKIVTETKSESFDGFDDKFETDFEPTPLRKMDTPKIVDTPTKDPIKETKLEQSHGFDDDFDADFKTDFSTDFTPEVKKQDAPIKKQEVIAPIELSYNKNEADGIMGFLGSMPKSKAVKSNVMDGFGDLFGAPTVKKETGPSFVDNMFNNLKKKEDVKKEKTIVVEIKKSEQFEGFETDGEWNEPKITPPVTNQQFSPQVAQFLETIPDLSFLNAPIVFGKTEFFEGFE